MLKLSKLLSKQWFHMVLLVLFVVGLVVLINCYCKNQNRLTNAESFQDYSGTSETNQNGQVGEEVVQKVGTNVAANNCNVPVNLNVSPSQPLGQNETPSSVRGSGTATGQQNPADCYPKDQLSPTDLLPDDPNSTWAQVNPAGQGELKDQNFLNAGYHIGVNTVGQTLRNANLQVRSEPPNPQVVVSPWLQTTIEPDTNRKPLEIGQGCP